MWLRNWYSLLNGLILSRTTDGLPGTNPTNEPPISYRSVQGDWQRVYSQVGENSFGSFALTPGKWTMYLGNNYNSGDYNNPYLIFGTGVTPVTLDDYRIETPITRGLNIASTTTTLVNKTSLNNGRYSYKTRTAVNNTSEAQITINEIAINAPRYAFHFAGSDTVCIYREVLNAPIVLDPGDTVLVEFEWNAPIYQAPNA